MIPVKYRYQMIVEWCQNNLYKLEWLSKDVLGTKNKITKLINYKDRDNTKYDSEWEKLSEFTGLDFNDPLGCVELRDILNSLLSHLSRFGNTVLSMDVYMCFESIDLIKFFETKGYKIKINFVEYTYDKSVIFEVIGVI